MKMLWTVDINLNENCMKDRWSITNEMYMKYVWIYYQWNYYENGTLKIHVVIILHNPVTVSKQWS